MTYTVTFEMTAAQYKKLAAAGKVTVESKQVLLVTVKGK